MSFHSSDVILFILMSFHSFRCHSNIISSFWCPSTHSNLISSFRCHSIHSDVILFIPMSFHSFRCHFNIISSFRCHSIHSNLIPSFWRHSSHSDVIPVILSCLRWPRNDFISEWREWPWNANFSHSRLILVILCYPRWSRKDGIFPFSSLSFRCHSVIRTSFWDQESIEMRSEWQIIWGRSRQSSLRGAICHRIHHHIINKFCESPTLTNLSPNSPGSFITEIKNWRGNSKQIIPGSFQRHNGKRWWKVVEDKNKERTRTRL